MNKSEVNVALLDMIKPIVEPLRFEKQKGEDGWRYHKITNFGYNEISLLVWPYGNIFYVDLVFSIRISDLNNVYNSYSSTSPDYFDINNTIGTGFSSNLSDDKIKIETPQELIDATQALEEVLIDKALPFFDHFIDIKSVDEEFNRDNRTPHLFAHDTDRCSIGLTAAALNRNPKFSYWEEYYRNKLKSASQNRKDKYEALVKHLKRE